MAQQRKAFFENARFSNRVQMAVLTPIRLVFFVLVMLWLRFFYVAPAFRFHWLTVADVLLAIMLHRKVNEQPPDEDEIRLLSNGCRWYYGALAAVNAVHLWSRVMRMPHANLLDFEHIDVFLTYVYLVLNVLDFMVGVKTYGQRLTLTQIRQLFRHFNNTSG